MGSPSRHDLDQTYVEFLAVVARLQEQVQAQALATVLRSADKPTLGHLLALLGSDGVDLVTFPKLGELRVGELLGHAGGPSISELLAEHDLPLDDPFGVGQRRPELLGRELWPSR